MAKKSKKDPYDVKLDESALNTLAGWLADEIRGEEQSRQQIIGDGGDLDYFWALYEQGSTRVGSDRPWPGAADLTSYLGTQYVDAFSSRVAKTIFVEPIWTVEGVGSAAERAPIVEEFMQWKAEENRLQSWIQKALRPAFVEGTSVLEVSEKAAQELARRRRQTKTLKVQTGPDQTPVLTEKGQPALAVDQATGQYAEGDPTAEPTAQVVVDELPVVPGGPAFRLLSLKDFLILPGHARDRSEVFGFAKSFYRRVPELQQRVDEGYYDAEAVAKLGTAPERLETPADTRKGQTIAPQRDDTAQKKLWEVLFLKDLDGKGERWYVATVSVERRVVLRVKYDELGDARFILFTPFPRSDSLYGYSLVQKMLTLIEEHTAIRNQIADRATLANSKPIKRLQGALWDPQEQPFGPGQVIDVRAMEELAEMQIADVGAPLIQRETALLGAAERVSGMNDVALGTQPQEDRTLGEVNLVAQQSFIRIDEVVRNIQEGMEDLFTILLALYRRALQGNKQGMPAPAALATTLQHRGVSDFDGAFTADMLAGIFRGKPRGSTETSDLISLRQDFNGWLGMVTKLWPEIFQDPEAKKSLLEQALRVYRVPDRQSILGVYDRIQQAQQQQAAQQATQQAAQPPAGGLPGAPPPPPGQPPPPHPINQVVSQMPQPMQAPPGMLMAPPQGAPR